MVMVSQAPGAPVPAAADCTWEFQAAAGRSVRVVVETLDLEPYRSAAKEGDKVVIRSTGATDKELTSTSFRKSYDVASSGISLSLETDRNDVGKTYGGFKATAYAVDACPVVGGNCTDQGFTCELTSGLQGPGCYDGGRAVGCACDLTACLEGSFFDESTGGCEACPPGTFKSAAGDTPCEPCPAKFFAPESGATMCCRDGYVLVDGFCRECGENVGDYSLKGATCDAANGTTVATLEIEQGYFRFSPDTTFLYPCPEDDDACRGSSPAAEGYGDGLCYTHAHGPLCMLCEEDYFRDNKMLDAPSKCVSCDRMGVQMRQLYTVLLMIVLWALVILGIRRLQSRFERQWFMAVLIQCVYFTVTMSRFVSIHQVPLPPVSKVFMRAFDVIAFDLSSLHSLARCWGWVDNYFNFLLWVTLVAPALLLVFVVCAVVRAVSRVACGATAAPQNALEEEGAAAEAVPLHRRVAAAVRQDLGGVLSKWMLLISLFHSAICCAIFQIFNCTAEYEPFGRSFLMYDYSIQCSGRTYGAYRAYAIVCAVIYVTFPLCLFLVLWQPRRLEPAWQERRKDPRHVNDGALAFLTKNLKAEYWWFEVLAIFLRSLVTGFFRHLGIKMSIVISLIITIIHRTVVLQLKPYASSGLQHVVEALMRFALSIVLVAVCLVGDLINEGDNATIIVSFVFVLNLSCLPIAYQAFVSESYRSVAQRLKARQHVKFEELEALLESAHAEAVREDVRKVSREILKEAFQGTVSEQDWTYFTKNLLALEGVWAPEVHAEEVLQWHVESMLARAKKAGGDGAIDAGAVERSVDIVVGPLGETLMEQSLSPSKAYEQLASPSRAGNAPVTLERVYAEVLSPFFQLDDEKPQKIWQSRKENHVLKLATMARIKSDKISTSLANLGSPPKSPTSPSSFSLSRRSLALSGVTSARSLLRQELEEPDNDAPTREENLASGMAHLRRAVRKITIARVFATPRKPLRLERFMDLSLIAHDYNQRAQARIAGTAAKVLREPRGDDVKALESFDNGTDQPALRSAELVAFKDKVGGAALESELDASVCVGALHDLANAAFPAFRAALGKLFPPDTEGVELECDADVAIKKKTRMRAKVDEYRREAKPWPRAEKLGDCLRASVVVAGAEEVVAAYEALAKDDIFKVVRLKNKLAERVKPFNLLVNLAFQPPAPLAPLIVEVQIVPKAIYDKQKASHRLYSIARASNYASFRGKKTAVDTAPEAADDGGDVEAPAAVRPGRHAEVARRPSLMSLPSFLSWTRTSTRPVVAPAPAPRLDAPT